MRQGLLLGGLLCLALPVTLAAQEFATGAETKPWAKFLGSWKQVPGPDDFTALKVEPEGGAIRFGVGCKQDGSCFGVPVANYDGRLSRYSKDPNDPRESSFRKVGDKVIQEDDYANGKLGRTVKWQLSPDGNTLTRTIHAVNPPGSKDLSDAYDRSGGPVSHDDPFIGFWKPDWNKSDARVMTFSGKGDVFTFTDTGGGTSERSCDGKEHADAGFLYSCGFPDERTYELVFTQNGKAYLTRTSKIISEDGKRMVRIDKNAGGKTTGETTFERIK